MVKKFFVIIIAICSVLLGVEDAIAGSYVIEGGFIGMGLGAGLGAGGYALAEGSSSTTEGKVIAPIIAGIIGFGIGALIGSTFTWNDYVLAPSVSPDDRGGQIYTLGISGRY